MTKLLVVGAGGREHALAWKLSQEAEVHAAPGNPGMADDCETHSVTAHQDIADLAKRLDVAAVVVGPETPLIEGLADRLGECGIPCFGPKSEGAQLEGSKAFSKKMMVAAGVRTADFQTFEDFEAALDYSKVLFGSGKGAVVKASGAAFGKGAIVCDSLESTEEALADCLIRQTFGDAGKKVVVEERLIGREFSLFHLVSDGNILRLPVAQDYKRAYDFDKGPNTGGMGGYCPADIEAGVIEAAEKDLVVPMVRQLTSEGISFRGVLFTGVMVAGGQPYCIEYNVRFGDPEMESLAFALGGGFSQAIVDCANGRPMEPIEVRPGKVATVIIAAPGYPDAPKKGATIELGDAPKGVKLFHCGTAIAGDILKVNGGRVFAATASADTWEAARALSYKGAESVKFDGAWFRTDIAASLA